jgi:hypothetical protein
MCMTAAPIYANLPACIDARNKAAAITIRTDALSSPPGKAYGATDAATADLHRRASRTLTPKVGALGNLISFVAIAALCSAAARGPSR